MIRIRIPTETIDIARRSDEELNALADRGIEVLQYEGPPEVELPDFGNHLTRGVYSGMIHSFMPPPSRSHHVLCQIDILSPEQLQDTQVETWLEAANRIPAQVHSTYRDDSVIILTLGRVIVYIVPWALSPDSIRTLVLRLKEAMSQQDDLEDASSYGILGALASAYICLHCYFDGHEFFVLGPGPPPGLMR